MNKTVTITLNGSIFHIEEDAYNKLKEYLISIENYYPEEDRDEIVNDIEISIAEKFGKLIKAKKQVVTMLDVEGLIDEMGTVEDFDPSDDRVLEGQSKDSYEEVKEEIEDDEKPLKKMYRNPDDTVIGGVCSGLGEYFGIDSVFIRIAFLLSIFFGGFGVVIYIILWIAMPNAETPSQKLEMKGDPVTIKQLEKVVKKNGEKINKNGSLKKITKVPFQIIHGVYAALKSFFISLGPIFLGIVGGVVVLASLAGIFALSFFGGIMLTNFDSPYKLFEFPLTEVISPAAYYLGIVLAYFVALVPLVFILLVGLSIAKRKNVFTGVTISALIGIWMICFLVLGVVGFDLSPVIEEKIREYETSQQTVKDFNLSNFEKLDIDSKYKINVSRGDDYSVSFKGRQSQINNASLEVEDGVLKVNKIDNIDYKCLFCDISPAQINIEMPDLEKVSFSGNVSAQIEGFELDKLEVVLERWSSCNYRGAVDVLDVSIASYSRLELDASPSILDAIVNRYSRLSIDDFRARKSLVEVDDYSKVYLYGDRHSSVASSSQLDLVISDYSDFEAEDFYLDSLNIEMDDYSDVVLDGQGDTATFELKNRSELDALDFRLKSATLSASNYSTAKIDVEEKLKIEATNHSSVYYGGKPKLEKEESRDAKVIKID